MRQVFTLANEFVRARVLQFIRSAPEGYQVIIDEPKRTLDQNAKFHALLDQFAEQADHFGKRLSGRSWKVILMVELGYELEYERSLDGSELIAIGTKTSELKARDFSALIELLFKVAAEKGITLREVEPKGRKARAA